MNDAEYEKERSRVLGCFEKWRKPIGLDFWTIHYTWDRSSSPDSVANADGYRLRVAMRTYADWRYLEATIIVFLPDTETLDDEELEYTCVHEFMHLFLAELDIPNEDKSHEERVATMLAKAFQWVGANEWVRLPIPFVTETELVDGGCNKRVIE